MDDEFLDPNDYYGSREDHQSRNPSTNTEVPNETLHRAIGWAASLLLLLAIGCLYAYPDWFSSSNSAARVAAPADGVSPIVVSTNKPSGRNIYSNKLEEIAGLSISTPEMFDWSKEEEIAANRAAVASFKNQLELNSKLANSNAEELVLLQSKTDELRTSQAGAKIASDKKYVEQFVALHEKISEMEVAIPVADSFTSDMNDLLKRVEGANDTSYVPQQFVISRADEFIKQHSNKSVEIRRFDNAIDRLIAETDELEAGVTLESAMQSYLKNADENLAEALVRADKEAKEKTQQQLVDAVKARIQSEADLEGAKIDAQTAGNVVIKDSLLAAAAKQKLEREFNADLNDINSYLLPFIAEGGNMRGNATGKGPASFLKIKSSGGLENTADGLSKLSNAAKNGRPLGGFPINILDFMIINNSVSGNIYNTAKYRSIEKYLERAQSLLNKYGPLMVEKGMLAE